jgi:uncharacterized protein (TIGR00369 family)
MNRVEPDNWSGAWRGAGSAHRSDGALHFACAGRSGERTADLRVDYHRPTISGPLTANGRVVKIGRRISVAETRVLGFDGKLLASGRRAYVC